MVVFLKRLLGRALRRTWQRLTRAERWSLAYRVRPPEGALPTNLTTFKLLETPTGHSFADPFLLRRNDEYHVFYEDYSHRAKRGVLAYSALGPDGSLSASQVVLEMNCHLSYPHVFVHRDTVYMIPEASDQGTVDLYLASNFPTEWRFHKTLLANTRAADATILQHAGHWWLFATQAPPGGSLWDELFLYFADSLEGHWTPHPMNPVVSDVRSARPAGRIFFYDDQLIRPAQDCSGPFGPRINYGTRIHFNRIEALTTREYAEVRVATCEPHGVYPGLRKTHSYSAVGPLEVVDAFRVQPSPVVKFTSTLLRTPKS